jgi:hypothetical protein
VNRGTIAQLNGHSAPLSVAGNGRAATLTRCPYLQAARPSRPLLLTR